jgi:membrane protease YdiL (CAAX protease family)
MDEIFRPNQNFGYTSPPPRNPRNVVGRLIAWAVIVLSVALIFRSTWLQSRRAPTATAPTPAPARATMQIGFLARYVIGVHTLVADSGKPDAHAQMLSDMCDQAAEKPADKLAAVVVTGELLGKEAALKRLKALTSSPPATQPSATGATGTVSRRQKPPPKKPGTQPSTTPAAGVALSSSTTAPISASGDNIGGVAQALQLIYTDGPAALSSDQRSLLANRLGWPGKLAATFGKSGNDPERAALLFAAKKTIAFIAILVVGGGIGVIAGLILSIIFLIRLSDRRLKIAYQPRPGSDVFLEAFAIYLGGVTAAMFGVRFLPGFLQTSLSVHVALMLIPTILAIAWPRLRGADSRTWRYGLGWHAGTGIFREMVSGVAGYLAGLPVVAVGFIISVTLIKASGATPTHPAIEQLTEGGVLAVAMVFLLAGVYAPLTEETMFRGAFFHALRSRHGWLVSAAITSFIFAAIHPQGWTLIPTLMAIALVFSGIREWRGTILASATAHCLHNTVLVLLAIMIMR